MAEDDDDSGEKRPAYSTGRGGWPVMNSVVDRYYTQYFNVELSSTATEDHYVHVHSNGIVVLGLAAAHPVVALRKRVAKINWDMTQTQTSSHGQADGAAGAAGAGGGGGGGGAAGGAWSDRSKLQISGKRKKGGQTLSAGSAVCEVQCSDGTRYRVRTCVQGKLIETNRRLDTDPQLLVTSPQYEGFIGLFLLKKFELSALTGAAVDLTTYAADTKAFETATAAAAAVAATAPPAPAAAAAAAAAAPKAAPKKAKASGISFANAAPATPAALAAPLAAPTAPAAAATPAAAVDAKRPAAAAAAAGSAAAMEDDGGAAGVPGGAPSQRLAGVSKRDAKRARREAAAAQAAATAGQKAVIPTRLLRAVDYLALRKLTATFEPPTNLSAAVSLNALK